MGNYKPIPQDEWAEMENQAYIKIHKELLPMNLMEGYYIKKRVYHRTKTKNMIKTTEPTSISDFIK